MLEVRNLDFAYDEKISVLKDISFQVEEGKLCGFFGPNGCGKTTLFKCCLKFLPFKKGNVFMDGQDVKNTSVKEMAKLISYVPQDHKPPFPYLVKDVVLMGRTPHLSGAFSVSKEDKRKAVEALQMVGIMDIADKPYNQLSGGQRQLVLIARAVAQETKLMFLDEPTSSLDFSNQVKVWKILKKITQKGTTVVACTHDPNHVLWFCDEVVVMGDNQLVASGTPEEIISEKILDQIYPRMCSVRNFEQTRMVHPKEVDAF